MSHGAARARHADGSPVPPCHPSQSRELLAEWVINLVTQLSLFHLWLSLFHLLLWLSLFHLNITYPFYSLSNCVVSGLL